ncbi:unnamed protein product [Orchesella dallaii]|uniref:Uncharacterized protein n=1 Tax=Orchesella dallaii TaxID=48710 RepID=A0ABP1Q9H0_9HEXA
MPLIKKVLAELELWNQQPNQNQRIHIYLRRDNLQMHSLTNCLDDILMYMHILVCNLMCSGGRSAVLPSKIVVITQQHIFSCFCSFITCIRLGRRSYHFPVFVSALR